MRPLAFQFKETPTGVDLDFSLIEYDDQLNLSVNKKTGHPAIDSISMDTETVTKAGAETSDTDQNGMKNLMDTETRTFTSTEQSDSDRDRMTMQALMDTSTLTESTESTDQDKDWK